MKEKPIIKKKGYDFALSDPETALIMALEELTHQIKRMANK